MLRTTHIRFVVALSLGLVLLASEPPSPAQAAGPKLTVPTDFPTIQAAVDAARPGATITVLAGTYVEQVRIAKSLKIVGSGAHSTVIAAPAVLSPRQVNPRPGRAVIVEIYNGASVRMERLAVAGPSGASCITISPPGGLAGFSVQQGADLTLDSAAIGGCTREAMLIGFSSSIPGGPGAGHATVTRTVVTGYRAVGLQAGGADTTLTLEHSTLSAAPDSVFVGQLGVLADEATARIAHNDIAGHQCNDPACGPDFFEQVQGTGIFLFEAGAGSTVAHNEIAHNDSGLTVAGASGCCDIHHNVLRRNRYFGLVIVDGDQTAAHDDISGSEVGVAVVATAVDTVGTLRHEKIVKTGTPIQTLSCCGVTAEAVVRH